MTSANCYTVWNNKTDELVILDGTSKECAKAMGITIQSFYSYLCKSKKGKTYWDIVESRQSERNKKTRKIKKLLNNGYSIRQIAESLNMSSELVFYYVKRIKKGRS